VANYVIALLGLVFIGVVWTARRRNEQPMDIIDVDHEEGEAA
jgi:hypothetical protein